jgi:hypothetical protein
MEGHFRSDLFEGVVRKCAAPIHDFRVLSTATAHRGVKDGLLLAVGLRKADGLLSALAGRCRLSLRVIRVNLPLSAKAVLRSPCRREIAACSPRPRSSSRVGVRVEGY